MRAQKNAPEQLKLADFADKSLLILDDDQPFLKRLSVAMEKRGFNVFPGSSMADFSKIIENDCAKYSLSYKLQKNEGIITNNILHGRKAFKDDMVKRTLLRIRSYERL